MIELKKQKKENKNKQMGSTKRKTSSTETEKDEGGEEGTGNGDNEDSNQAGHEFDRSAHKKKKVTISAAATVVPTRVTLRHVMAATTQQRRVALLWIRIWERPVWIVESNWTPTPIHAWPEAIQSSLTGPAR